MEETRAPGGNHRDDEYTSTFKHGHKVVLTVLINDQQVALSSALDQVLHRKYGKLTHVSKEKMEMKKPPEFRKIHKEKNRCSYFQNRIFSGTDHRI